MAQVGEVLPGAVEQCGADHLAVVVIDQRRLRRVGADDAQRATRLLYAEPEREADPSLLLVQRQRKGPVVLAACDDGKPRAAHARKLRRCLGKEQALRMVAQSVTDRQVGHLSHAGRSERRGRPIPERWRIAGLP